MMTVREKIDMGWYKTTLPFPEFTPRPRLGPNPTAVEAREYAQALDVREEQIKIAEDMRATYDQDQARLTDQFIQDAIEEAFGPLAKQFPKTAQALYGVAYEYGHAYGYYEINTTLNGLSPVLDAVAEDMKAQGVTSEQ